MATKVAYYKGCLASLSAKELDISTQALAPKLGLELDELEAVTCCGAGDIHEAEPDYYLHLNARILANAALTGADTLMTICNVCTLNLRQANWQLKNDEALRARVNTNLESVGVPAYEKDVEVKHFLWLIAEGEGYELLKGVAHKGLKGMKIAPFYGCQILRPSKLLGFEDPDRPSSLERIIEACGGDPIDYPAKIKCCGFPIIQAREETALSELIQPIEQALEAGADAMVTPCPLCHLSLDAWQSKLEKSTGRTLGMPILHLSQLIGVAAGFSDSELKFKRHVVPVTARHREALRLTAAWVGIGLAVAAAACLVWGWCEAGWVRLRVLDVELPGLPAELDGLRIAHLSDFHLGVPGRGGTAARRAVEWTRERDPDLVCVTGDLVSRPRGEPELRRLLERLPRCYAILGNHDIGAKRDPFSKAVELTALDPATLLLDEGRMLDVRGVRVLARRPRSGDARHRARPEPGGGALDPPRPLSVRDRSHPRGLVRPRARRAHARRPDLRPVPRREDQARPSDGALHARALPPRSDGDARLAGARHDVRSLPVLRAAGGDGARAAGRKIPRKGVPRRGFDGRPAHRTLG